ncbi:protein of unknown function [Candidatus Nitrotoga arctica]|uniref:Uncharacterized protein n=1 Tax=Candidatus Nitrotoga arctica TaxID=453162 RepID=A0ABM8YX86_9PROT|nr:protein of unknown function [Candidatus Nitrotoga arctica]
MNEPQTPYQIRSSTPYYCNHNTPVTTQSARAPKSSHSYHDIPLLLHRCLGKTPALAMKNLIDGLNETYLFNLIEFFSPRI